MLGAMVSGGGIAYAAGIMAERSANSPSESVPEQSGGSEKEVPGA